ncbi:glycoside hydrolase family 113 [Rudanella lutea]|uniref:glycoside hydrolase family 113 n=1 Tax=Rudanella lutea TaxID=451374 RepID=UPI00035FCB91|nr:hypothetical protein [Rudanella lutea]
MQLSSVLLLLGILSCQSVASYRTQEPKMKGVNLVAPPRQPAPDALSGPRQVGADWVAVVPYGFCQQGDPHFYYSGNPPPGRRNMGQWWGETPQGVAETIRMAREQNLRVMLKPHVWMMGGSHLDLAFANEADWLTFETDYTKYILHNAHLADSLRVDLFCITTELDRFAVARPQFWSRLIGQVKAIYKGKLTYAANWDRYAQIPFWNELDYIGVDAYFPLSDSPTPSVRAMNRGWKDHVQALGELSGEKQKPILFTEFGYRACTYTARRPWESDTDCTPSEQAQAQAYTALFESVWHQPWFAGGFVWKWFLTDSPNTRHPDQYSPQNRAAANTLKDAWH